MKSLESLYRNPIVLLIGALVVFIIGTTATTFAPLWFNDLNNPIENVRPYTPTELRGRALYISEGCVNCHTQQVRPLKSEVARYGTYSRPGEYVYDLPHQLGTRRIGPDLAREGGKRPDRWHRRHFKNPQQVMPGSIMPRYDWWSKEEVDAMIAYMQVLGTGIDWRSKQVLEIGVNPYANDPQAILDGKALFADRCQECHEEGGVGQEDEDDGPNLTDSIWRYRSDDKGVYKTISLGTENGMPSFKNELSEDELWKLTNYTLSLQKSH